MINPLFSPLPTRLLTQGDASRSGNLTIDFTPLSLMTWHDLCARAHRFPLTQSYDYACAIASTSAFRPKWGVIYDATTKIPLGIVQLFELRVTRRFIQSVTIDRGPIWFLENGSTSQIESFWCAINALYPRRFWRRRRFIPEDMGIKDPYIHAGLVPHPTFKPYQTIWMDLTRDMNDIESGFRKSWRHCLQVARNNENIGIEYSQNIMSARSILHDSIIDATRRGYSLPPHKLIGKMIDIFSKNKSLHVITATEKGCRIAGMMVFNHGPSATWQVGFVSDRARKLYANHRLIFDIMIKLKQCGVTSLDLGGMNDDDAKGVSFFKSGLRGDPVAFVGAFQ